MAFVCKTATFGLELQVSIGPRPHLSFCALKTAPLWPELQIFMGPRPPQWICACKTACSPLISMGLRPHLWIWACKTACLSPEILVTMGPSSHLWFLNEKQRIYDQRYKSLWVPALICGLCVRNSDYRAWITSLYWSQTSPVIFCM